MQSLEGAAIVVTGAASGIGRQTALRLAEYGCRLVINDVDEAGLRDLEAQLLAAGASVVAIAANVAEDGAAERLVGSCCDRYGQLTGFFSNAGVTGRLVPVSELDSGDWLQVLSVNLVAAAQAIRHAAAAMLSAQRGSIVCTASVAGLRAGAGPAHYSASKAGLINLVQSAACQFAGSGVRVNAVCPGLIETQMTAPLFELARAAGKEDRIGQLNPLRRAGSADEIADAVCFLLSDAASYVNGQALVVDGGLSATHPFVPGSLF